MFSQENLNGPYNLYQVVAFYEGDMGLVPLPRATAGGGSRFVQIHGPNTILVVEFTVGRYHIKPKIPDPTPTNPSLVLLRWKIGAFVPVSDETSTLWQISGRYEYGMKAPLTIPGELQGPTPHSDQRSLSETKITRDLFVRGLLWDGSGLATQ